MAKTFHKGSYDEPFRMFCPECEGEWSTLTVPCECPCGALVTFRTIRKPKAATAEGNS